MVKFRTIKIPYTVSEGTPCGATASNPAEFADLLRAFYVRERLDFGQEHFVVTVLNSRNSPVAMKTIFTGGVVSTIIDPRPVYRMVVSVPGGTAIVLAHNHPGGSIMPSKDDVEITKRLKVGFEMLDFKLLDHVIIPTDRERMGFFSFSEGGLL